MESNISRSMAQVPFFSPLTFAFIFKVKRLELLITLENISQTVSITTAIELKVIYLSSKGAIANVITVLQRYLELYFQCKKLKF